MCSIQVLVAPQARSQGKPTVVFVGWTAIAKRRVALEMRMALQSANCVCHVQRCGGCMGERRADPGAASSESRQRGSFLGLRCVAFCAVADASGLRARASKGAAAGRRHGRMSLAVQARGCRASGEAFRPFKRVGFCCHRMPPVTICRSQTYKVGFLCNARIFQACLGPRMTVFVFAFL